MIGWTEILRVHIKNQIKEKCMNYFVHIFTTSIVIFSDEGVVFLQSKYYIIHCSDYFVLQTLVFWRPFFPFSPQLVIPVEWKSLEALVKAPQSDNLLFDRTDRTYCNHIVYYSINLTFHRMHSESLIMQELQPKVRVGLVLYLTKGLDNLFYPNKGLRFFPHKIYHLFPKQVCNVKVVYLSLIFVILLTPTPFLADTKNTPKWSWFTSHWSRSSNFN